MANDVMIDMDIIDKNIFYNKAEMAFYFIKEDV